MTARQNAFPEPDSPDNDDYRVHARREVVAILKDIAERRVLVTLYYRGVERFIITNLLAVDPEVEEVVFDAAPDLEANRLIAASDRLTFVTFVGNIKTQFSAGTAAPTQFEKLPALRIRLPDSVMRLQRRNFYRVPTPKGAPLTCEVPLPDGSRAVMEVDDLSVGGLAMLAGPASTAFEAGTVFRDCRIELPDHGVILTALELRNHRELRHGDAVQGRVRLGCRFLKLDGTVENLIQRYINHIERARRALS
jgi:c-di-GMP-binding flagellar brake protein YcgR